MRTVNKLIGSICLSTCLCTGGVSPVQAQQIAVPPQLPPAPSSSGTALGLEAVALALIPLGVNSDGHVPGSSDLTYFFLSVLLFELASVLGIAGTVEGLVRQDWRNVGIGAASAVGPTLLMLGYTKYCDTTQKCKPSLI